MVAKIWIVNTIEVEGSVTESNVQVFADENDAQSAFEANCEYLKNQYDCTPEENYDFAELTGVEEAFWTQSNDFFEIKRNESLCHVTCSLEIGWVNYEELEVKN